MVLELHVENLAFAYGAKPVLREITLPAMRSGEVTAVLGPNATGKSTLLRCIAGIQRPSGTVTITGDNSATTPTTHDPRRGRQRDGNRNHIIYVPQDLPPASSITVFEAVLLACQQRAGLRPSDEVIARVSESLARLKIAHLAGAPISDLSGGQRQMVSLAQAIARRPAVLLLDEPTSNLDLRNQLEILNLVRTLAASQPAVVVLTIHDLSLAARFADHVAILHGGTLHSSGSPSSVITEPMLREVYQVDATVHHTSDGALTLAATREL